MQLWVIGSVKGAPGATTVAVGLAAYLSGGGSVLLVEADPHGGDLAARFGHADSPGLASAATASRHGTAAGWLLGHVQRLAVGVQVLLAPAAAEPASAAVAAVAAHPAALGGAASTVVVDAGRLVPGSPALALLDAADVVLLVAHPRLDGLSHVAARLSGMGASVRGRVRLVLVGDGGYPPAEIARDLGVPVVAVVPVDRRGAAVLAGRHRPVRGWRRLPLPRAIGHLAAGLPGASPRRAGLAVKAGAPS